jgi:CRISPR-associated endonuclease/helicase Cas3
VIRRHDFHGLFSTEKDLAGGCTDVSPYIRNSDDADVYIFWRDFDGKPRNENEPEPKELCPVRVHEAREFAANDHRLWEWNDDADAWELRRGIDIVPGMSLLCAGSEGGYSEELGWTGSAKDRPQTFGGGIRKNSDSRDPSSESASWYPLALHLEDTEKEAAKLAADLRLEDRHAQALTLAARWHDIGKSLPAWQAAVKKATGADYRAGVWAKFPKGARAFRPGLRHEEASALYAAEQWKRGRSEWSELALYLIACHHGKVRLALGAHGAKSISRVKDPTLCLTGWIDGPAALQFDWLGFAPLGNYDRESGEVIVNGRASWQDIVGQLLGPEDGVENSPADVLGPFRLAWLEALIVAADVRASQKVLAMETYA